MYLPTDMQGVELKDAKTHKKKTHTCREDECEAKTEKSTAHDVITWNQDTALLALHKNS